MSAAPRKNAALPATSRPVGSLVAQPARGFKKCPRVDIEYRLGIGLVAGFRIVAGQDEDIVDAERGSAHQFALQRDAVFVAASDLQDRLDADVDHDF
jgi:hypothetical protein